MRGNRHSLVIHLNGLKVQGHYIVLLLVSRNIIIIHVIHYQGNLTRRYDKPYRFMYLLSNDADGFLVLDIVMGVS